MPPADVYARVFETAQTGLLLLEKVSGQILQVNNAFLRLTGRDRAEVLGRSFWAPPLVDDAAAGSEIHAHLLSGGAISGAELPLKTGDGRWLLLEVDGGLADGRIQLEVRDITGREQARIADRLETLRLQAARTAAEFQSLHSALLTVGQVLLISAGQGGDVLGELEQVRQASERAGSIAEQLTAFGGATDLQLRPVALNDLVESMLPRLRQLFGRDVEILADLSPETPTVLADPVRLRQVVLKLATNSHEAMGPRGTFCLQTGSPTTVEPALGTSSADARHSGMLAVSDSGPGLDDQSWAHLYEPFFSTKANGRGRGLGLAAVYGIVRQTGGRIWAYSQPGRGATFRIYLPVAGAQLATAQSTEPEHLCGATILLVESHDEMRVAMANLLRKRGYRVLAAIHSEEALRIAQTQGTPDLLISRPEPELVHCLERLQPVLRVLYLGGTCDPEPPPQIHVLRKPFEPDTLLEKVLELLER